MKLAEKRGKDMTKWRTVMEWLLTGSSLPSELGDHPLKGEWKASRDLHIEPDWVPIYRVDGGAIRFERTGTQRDRYSPPVAYEKIPMDLTSGDWWLNKIRSYQP